MFITMEVITFILYLFMCIIVLPISVIINGKLYKKTNAEEHLEKGKVIQHLIKTYSLLQCICWPCIVIFPVICGFVDVLCEIGRPPLYQYILFAYRFCTCLYRDYISFNSLIVAISRYTFVVFGGYTEAFGIPRVKAVLVSGSFVVPIVNSILFEFTQPTEQEFFAVFFDEASVNEKTFLTYPNKTVSKNYPQSPVYTAVNTYVPPGFVYIMSIMTNIMMVLIYSNIIEGFLYAHIIMSNRRYE